MALRGTDALVSVATTTGGTYTAIDGISGYKTSRKGNNIDITILTAEFIKRMQGLKDATHSLSGFREPADTLGQNVILAAWTDNTELHFKALADGTNGFKQKVVVESFDDDVSADGTVELSIELAGADAMVLIP